MRTRSGINMTKSTALVIGAGVSLALSAVLAGCTESESGGGGNGGATTATGGAASTNAGGSSNSSAGGATTSTSSSGGSTNAGGATASGGATATGPGVWATINVELVAEDAVAAAHTNMGAFGKDAAPIPDSFKPTKEVGACKLLEPNYVLCDAPKCTNSETCVATDRCQTNPAPTTLGDLTVKGLKLKDGGGTEFTLSPVGTSYQAAGATAVDYPPCTVGQEISVSGGAEAATKFSVKSSCIDTLVVPNATTEVPFEAGKAAQFSWTAAAGGNSRVTVRIDISHHGGLKGLIVCDAPDTGSLQVDASLVTGLIGLGTAGFPVARVTRTALGTAPAGSGAVTLNVFSWVELSLAIPGVKSCSSDAECATGQTCTSLKCQ